ncbi:MAG: amidohydrolase [Chloroflexi bacterium]|nr:amidohydrolase [Chloroflexota bacterium]MBV9895402.1 amidohydrolase [Chloroflexota bacterium]
MAETAIVTAGRIITMAETAPEAFAMTDGRVVSTGRLADLRDQHPSAEVLDFGRAVVVPGFHDAHLHLASTADQLMQVDLSYPNVQSLAEVGRRIRDRAVTTGPGQWIIGSRYDDGKMAEDRPLTRFELDEVAPDHPVLVRQVAGHWGVVNSQALALGGLDDSSQSPEGGAYGRDGAGRLNGVLYERALVEFVRSPGAGGKGIVPANTLDDRLAGLERAATLFAASGLTSVRDASTGPEDLTLFEEGRRRGLLNVRVSMLVRHESYEAVRRDNRWLDGEFLRVTGVKAVLDGAIGGRTCLLEQPFEGTTDDHGIQAMSTRDLHDLVGMLARDGQRPCVHANGDRAISLLLDLLEQIGPEMWPMLRPRVEHCSIVTDSILQRLKRVGAVTTPFASYVHYHGNNLRKWYGEQRLSRMFAHRSFLDSGVPVAAASDFGCGPFEPLLGMQSCVTRAAWDGGTLGENQRITAREALALYTTGAAFATGEEHVKGKLAAGYYADFVVLGDDPLTVEPMQLSQIPVLATYVAGTRVWRSKND